MWNGAASAIMIKLCVCVRGGNVYCAELGKCDCGV